MATESSVLINEIQISGGAGKTSEDYIELYNPSAENLDISNWKLRKRTQSGTESSIKVFSDSAIIPAQGYFLWSNASLKDKLGADESTSAIISANNSIALLNDAEKIIDQVAWGIGHSNPFIEGASLIIPSGQPERIERKNFQDSGNNITDFKIISDASPTPSGCLSAPSSERCSLKKENDSNKNTSIRLDIPDEVYVNVSAEFEVFGLNKEDKVTWTFGDGHKSYKQKTTHKYEEIGKYSASLKYSTDGATLTENFIIEVEEISHPKVSIISINPNPKGSDDAESLVIKNKSKKKVNLQGWSIATGWKKLINHPITEDFEIKKGKEKEITKAFSKFTLSNTKTKIELRYPDGEVAYDVKYKKDKIVEGEVYTKIDSKWQWITPKKSAAKAAPAPVTEEINPPITEEPKPEIIPEPELTTEDVLGKLSVPENKLTKQDVEMKLFVFKDSKKYKNLPAKSESLNQGFVLGTATFKNPRTYHQLPIPESYLQEKFLEINSALNKLLFSL